MNKGKTTNTKKLIRPTKGRVVAGVALGLANYFNIDVTIVRLMWVFLLIPGGLPGFIPYAICWLVIPSED
jgi:phage shock protein C